MDTSTEKTHTSRKKVHPSREKQRTLTKKVPEGIPLGPSFKKKQRTLVKKLHPSRKKLITHHYPTPKGSLWERDAFGIGASLRGEVSAKKIASKVKQRFLEVPLLEFTSKYRRKKASKSS